MLVRSTVDDPDSWVALTGRHDPPDASCLGRWAAIEAGKPIAGVETRTRPDGRVFLSYHGSDRAAQRILIETVRTSIAGPVHVICGEGRPADRQVLIDIGFETTLIEDVFRVDFGKARAAVSRAWVPTGHSIVSASMVDMDRLFDLDNRLRHLVPGTEGWQGDPGMFAAELTEAPPFDPAGYLIGRDDRSDQLMGLVRFWRNPSGPRLGMIGVLPERRGTTLGPALLKRGLEAASAWGSNDFVTETSRANRHIHHRLIALGAEVTGSFEILTG